MSFCIFKVNSTGKYGFDVSSKFPGGQRDGYTILECGLKTRAEAERRVKNIEAEQADKNS